MATASKATEAKTTAAENDQTETDAPSGVVEQPLKGLFPVTAPDNQGVRRVVGQVDDGWTPAPVDPHPDDVKAAEDLEKRIEDALTDSEQKSAEDLEKEREARVKEQQKSRSDG